MSLMMLVSCWTSLHSSPNLKRHAIVLLKLEMWQGPPHINKVKQYEAVLSCRVSHKDRESWILVLRCFLRARPHGNTSVFCIDPSLKPGLRLERLKNAALTFSCGRWISVLCWRHKHDFTTLIWFQVNKLSINMKKGHFQISWKKSDVWWEITLRKTHINLLSYMYLYYSLFH